MDSNRMTGRYEANLPPINLYQGLHPPNKGGLGSSILYENPLAFLFDQKLNATQKRVLNSTHTSNPSEFVCRICLEEEDPDEAEDNPFIVPCKCMGSMKYIHVKCMREWIDSKK